MNKQNRLLVLVLIAVLVAGVITRGSAAAQTGPGVQWWVIGGGGGAASGGDVSLNDTLGQPISGPASSGGDVMLDVGYWQVLAPATITDLRASVAAGKLKLDWTVVAHDTGDHTITGVTYDVYRAQNAPYFNMGVPYETGLASPTYTDPDATVIGNTSYSTYYVVCAVYSGLLAGPSNRAGVFAFPLVPGGP